MSGPPLLFDRELIARRLAARGGAGNFVIDLVREDLAERLGAITRRFAHGLGIAPEARILPERVRTAEGEVALERRSSPGADGPFGPATNVGSEYDLVISLLDLQAIDDVPGYLAAIRRAMRPDGLFIAAALGGNSLTELRRAWLAAEAELFGGAVPRVAPMLDVRDAGMLLQRAGFALPVTDVETHVLRYADPMALMREIRAMGASNPLRSRGAKLVSRRLLTRAVERYGEIAGDEDGRVRATLDIVWMSAWTPHASQQKPLKPGSASARLADVLKDKSGR